MTQSGMTVGTPAYMAPEQAMAKEIERDLYSTGVIACRLLQQGAVRTRTRPGRSSTPTSTTAAALRSLNPDVDPALAARWRKHSRRADDRPADAPRPWHALEDILLAAVGPVWRREARVETRPHATASDAVPTPPESSERATRSHVTPAAPTEAVEGGAPEDLLPEPVRTATVPPTPPSLRRMRPIVA